jgi:hypothetical protein
LCGVVVADGLFVDAARARFVGQAQQVHGSLAKLRFRGENDPHFEILLLKKLTQHANQSVE